MHFKYRKRQFNHTYSRRQAILSRSTYFKYEVGLHTWKIDVDNNTIKYPTTGIKKSILLDTITDIAIADDRYIFDRAARPTLQKLIGIKGGMGKLLIAYLPDGNKKNSVQPSCLILENQKVLMWLN